MIYVALIGCVLLTMLVFSITSFITHKVLKHKSEKAVIQLKQEYTDKSKRKEEVIQDANKKKESVNTIDTQSSFDSSIDILHQLSQKRK